MARISVKEWLSALLESEWTDSNSWKAYFKNSTIRLIHVFEVVNIRRGPKNGLTPECEARGC